MTQFENLARNLGENRFAYKALSIIQLLSTCFIFLLSAIAVIYYFTLYDSSIHNTNSKLEFVRFGLIICPFVALFCVIMSVFWVVLNFKQQVKRWLAMGSIFGTVFQVVLGFVGIITTGLLYFMIGGGPFVIVSFILFCLCEVWWVIAVVGSLANVRWLDMNNLEDQHWSGDINEGGIDGREQLIDEE